MEPMIYACRSRAASVTSKAKSNDSLASLPTSKESKEGFLQSLISKVTSKKDKLPDSLHAAIQEGRVQDVCKLLQNFDPKYIFEKTNSNGDPPLIAATQCGHKDIVELLLRYGDNVNRQNTSGATPLMIASKVGNLCIMQTLLRNPGIAVNHTDFHHKTALLWCMQASDEHYALETVKILLENGVNPSLEDKSGNTALTLAKKKGFFAIADVLCKHMHEHKVNCAKDQLTSSGEFENSLSSITTISSHSLGASSFASSHIDPGEDNTLAKTIQVVAKRIGTDWKMLFRDLYLQPGQQARTVSVKHIEHKAQGLYDMAYEALMEWRQSQGDGATVQVLRNALLECGRKDIADMIKDQET